MTNKNDLTQKFFSAKTTSEVKKLVISLFEESSFGKTRKGIEDFKRNLESNVPNIDQFVTKNTQGTGNGIVEILEDYLHL